MSAMVEKKISTWKESIKLGKKYTWKQFKKYNVRRELGKAR